jgi:galactokinase
MLLISLYDSGFNPLCAFVKSFVRLCVKKMKNRIQNNYSMSKIDSLLSRLENNSIQAFQILYDTGEETCNIQRKRYSALLKKYLAVYGNADVALFSAPGRTEIGGNHTDHNHGRVLAGAVNLDNIVVAAPNYSDIISIESMGYPKFEVDISSLEPVENEKYTSAAILRGICAGISNAGFNIKGFNAVIDGGVPKGSGLSSSAAFEVLIGTIINHLFNEGKIDAVKIAQLGQYAENVFFGKPCGLMDQTASSVGGLVAIDFENPANPVITKVPFDFAATGYSLVITDTGGHHADLNDEYASLPIEMKSVARELGKEVLRQVSLEEVIHAIPLLREKTGDRAILRAMHFQGDNQRVVKQVEALKRNDFREFLDLVVESGRSSFMYNQNIFPVSNVREQGVSLGLALSELVLKGKGAWRVHGGGFAGTIQAFVPADLMDDYISTLEHVFGEGACYKLSIRPVGAVKVEF